MLSKQYNALRAPEVSHRRHYMPGTERSAGTKSRRKMNVAFGFFKYVFGFCRKLQFNVKHKRASRFLSNENDFN